MGYPVENRFRRPVELLASVFALAAPGVLWLHSALFLVTPATGGVTTLGLLALAWVTGKCFPAAVSGGVACTPSVSMRPSRAALTYASAR